MAKTVGLPVAIATLKILNGEISMPGVQIPISKEVYKPILKELKKYGIVFTIHIYSLLIRIFFTMFSAHSAWPTYYIIHMTTKNILANRISMKIIISVSFPISPVRYHKPA